MKYISCIGLEGAGKSTVIAVITKFLNDKGIDVIRVREPGGTPIAETLRDIVKSKDHDEELDAISEALLIYAGRNQLINNRVVPALNAGKVVLTDRCYACGDAYQGSGGGASVRLLNILKEEAVAVKPDLHIYLDVPPAVGLARVDERGERDRFEENDLSFFEKAREGYLKFCNENNAIVVDATQSQEDVSNDVLRELSKYF